MVLNKAQIFAAIDLASEKVFVPEWSADPANPEYVIMRALTGAQRDAYEAQIFQIRTTGGTANAQFNRVNVRAKLVALTAVDDEGNRIFADNEVEELGNKSARILDQLFDVAQRLSGLRAEDVKALEGN